MRLQPWQYEVIKHTGRYRVVCCGRKSGKTWVLPYDMIYRAQQGCRRIWYVSPALDQTNEIWQRWMEQEFRPYIKLIRRSPKQITLKNETQISFKTAGSGDRLRSAGLDALYVDEAAYLPEDMMTQVLLPMLTVSGGPILLVSTPNGANWFKEWYDRYAHWHATSLDNPYVDRGFIEEQRASLPDVVFKQEYLAQFVADQNAALQDLGKAIIDDIIPYPITAVGIDVGRYQDATAVVALDDQQQVQQAYTYQEIPTEQQIEIIERHWIEWDRPRIALDATGYGQAISDLLHRRHIPHRPIKFTKSSRSLLYSNLITALENGRIKIPKRQKALITELRDLRWLKKDDHYRYDHPSGKHDDLVVALALCFSLQSNINKRAFKADVPLWH